VVSEVVMASVRLQVGSSVWQARFIDGQGKKRDKSTGTTHRREAQKIADAYEAAAQRKFTVAHVQRTLRELMADATGTPMPGSTVAEFFRALVAKSRVENAPATLAFYEYNSRAFLMWCASNLPQGGKTQMASVQPSHLELYRAWRMESVGVATVNHAMKFIRQAFARAARAGLLLESPAAGISRIRRHEPAEIRPFTLDEVRALILASDDEWQSLILFGLYTGQRLGDLARLDWKNINLDRGEVCFSTQKTKKRMLIPLALPLVTRLAAVPVLDRLGPLHSHASYVVGRDGKVGKLSSEFRRIMAKCGLAEDYTWDRKKSSSPHGRSTRKTRAEISFHSLRHTATSLLSDSGAPRGVAMELIGHDSATVHRHYAHLGTDTLRRAVSLLPSL
jgi:integrase